MNLQDELERLQNRAARYYNYEIGGITGGNPQRKRGETDVSYLYIWQKKKICLVQVTLPTLQFCPLP